MIVVSILAKNKSVTLPIYLNCILAQTYPKNKIHLYIRTNDNTDDTEAILTDFVDINSSKYASVHYDVSSISEELKKYENHEWNTHRFIILGKIRQDSIAHAIYLGAHYFVADCDNFLEPNVLQDLFDASLHGIIAPMLDSTSDYSNFHDEIDVNGYLNQTDNYNTIRWRIIKGLIEVKVVHCTYFIHNKFLSAVCYDDKTYRYEYVIFSDSLRKHNIPQLLDNRKDYGCLTFAVTDDEFKNDIAHDLFLKYKNILTITNETSNSETTEISS